MVPSAADPSRINGLGAWHLAAGADRPSEVENSAAFLFPAGCCSDLWDGWASPTATLEVLAFPNEKLFIFLLAGMALLSSRRRAGESSRVGIAFIRLIPPASALRLKQGLSLLSIEGLEKKQ
jgi:hypothetical protein